MALDDNEHERWIRALVGASIAVEQWTGNSSYEVLYDLLGYGKFPPPKFSERDISILELLAGPNGYTVYRVLLARKDDGR